MSWQSEAVIQQSNQLRSLVAVCSVKNDDVEHRFI